MFADGQACELFGSDSSSDSDEELEKGLDHDDVSHPLYEMKCQLREITRSLLRLSMSIQNPAPYDRYMAATSTSASFYEEFDLNHVKQKFPGMKSFLSERLSRSITAKRQFLKYSEAHRSRLKAEDPGGHNMDSKSTKATSLPPALLSPKGESEGDLDDIGSFTSFAISKAADDSLRVPPFPETASYEDEFECPLCFCIICVPNWSGWK